MTQCPTEEVSSVYQRREINSKSYDRKIINEVKQYSSILKYTNSNKQAKNLSLRNSLNKRVFQVRDGNINGNNINENNMNSLNGNNNKVMNLNDLKVLSQNNKKMMN